MALKNYNNLHQEDQPSYKAINKSFQVLKDHELIHLITGADRKVCMQVASIPHTEMTVAKLEEVGLTNHQAMQLMATDELTTRREILKRKKITSAEDVYNHLADYADRQQEHFLVITLDGASRIINTRCVFIGTLNQSLVHPREVFNIAIKDNSAGIILAHNHPSGTLSASRADIGITQRLQDVSKLVGIEVLDHVILAEDGFYSFADEGLL